MGTFVTPGAHSCEAAADDKHNSHKTELKLPMLSFSAASQEVHHQCTALDDAAGDHHSAAAACSAEQQTAPTDFQLEGLLQIKAALDADDVMVQWTRQTGHDQGYCRCTSNWRSAASSLYQLLLSAVRHVLTVA
jgi:hypothetical protein